MSTPAFTKKIIAEVVNDTPPDPMNLLLAVGDIDGDGRQDVVISGRDGRMVWLENNGTGSWPEHLIDGGVSKRERGGVLYDVTGNGLPDVISGGDWRSDEICWWENPSRPGVPWTKRLIARTGKCQIHDIAVGDVTGDGSPSLIFTNQIGGTDIWRMELPAHPTADLWRKIDVIAEGRVEPNPFSRSGWQPEEGLAIGDVDGDGKPELVCGTHWYKHVRGKWQAHRFTAGYITTKVALGDVDGDGRNEIVLAEADPCVYGREEGGRLAWFKPDGDVTATWREHEIASGLLDPHSLQLGDLFGHGRMDILAGEVGTVRRRRFDRLRTSAELWLSLRDDSPSVYGVRAPNILLFENDGAGSFARHVVDAGTGIHDGVLVDVLNRGVSDIVGKPLHGPERWNVHVWFRNDRTI